MFQLRVVLYRTVGTNIYSAFVHMDVPFSRQLTLFNQLRNVTERLAVSEELHGIRIVLNYWSCSPLQKKPWETLFESVVPKEGTQIMGEMRFYGSGSIWPGCSYKLILTALSLPSGDGSPRSNNIEVWCSGISSCLTGSINNTTTVRALVVLQIFDVGWKILIFPSW